MLSSRQAGCQGIGHERGWVLLGRVRMWRLLRLGQKVMVDSGSERHKWNCARGCSARGQPHLRRLLQGHNSGGHAHQSKLLTDCKNGRGRGVVKGSPAAAAGAHPVKPQWYVACIPKQTLGGKSNKERTVQALMITLIWPLPFPAASPPLQLESAASCGVANITLHVVLEQTPTMYFKRSTLGVLFKNYTFKAVVMSEE
eukprot:1146964-Pelagomonas_calceolata.AAC.1